jgi:dUTPase
MTEVPVYKFAFTNELIKSCRGTEFRPEDFLPTRAEPDATGWDVRCADPEGFTLKPECYYMMSLGFKGFIPDGWWADLKPRSSTFHKRNCHALYGTIDMTFPKEWKFLCQYMPDASKCYGRKDHVRVEFGDRIAQIIPVKLQEMIPEISSIEEVERLHHTRGSIRTGGFGSTDLK